MTVKAEALASYARQADDDELFKMARRIQSRAINRCGELLKQLDARPQNSVKQKDGADLLLSRTEAAAQVGLSERQRKTAVRVANIPAEVFEELIESDDPPSVTDLAEMGKANSKAWAEGPKPEGFEQATKLLGSVRRFADFCKRQRSAPGRRGGDAERGRQAAGADRDHRLLA